MSDLQDIIAKSGVNAYNAGLRDGMALGKAEERALLLQTLREVAYEDDLGEKAYLADFFEVLEDKHG